MPLEDAYLAWNLNTADFAILHDKLPVIRPGHEYISPSPTDVVTGVCATENTGRYAMLMVYEAIGRTNSFNFKNINCESINSPVGGCANCEPFSSIMLTPRVCQGCKPGYYIQNGGCVACHGTCLTCTGFLETSCLICP